VKEDVILPLLRRYGSVTAEVLECAPATADPLETLVSAFTTEIHRRQLLEFDRKFVELLVKNQQYRLRWLELGDQLYEPITEFLSSRYELEQDHFLRMLPAQLITHASRQAYLHWIEDGSLLQLEANHRRGFALVLGSLRPIATSLQ
jgi:hypothetical protein